MQNPLYRPADPQETRRHALAELGARVRAWRARRGMTRKQLAADSGLSERFLADVESGKGNVSINSLEAAARALQYHHPGTACRTRRDRRWPACRACLIAARRDAARPGLQPAGQHLRPDRRAGTRVAHCADRPARRRQVDAGRATGSAARRALRRTGPRDRARGRHQHERDPVAARAGRLPPLRTPRAASHRRGACRRRGHDHGRQHRQRARDLRAAAKPLLLRLAQGQPGGAHGPRGGAGRPAALWLARRRRRART